MSVTPDPNLRGHIIEPPKPLFKRFSSWFSSRPGQLQGAIVTGSVMVALWLFTSILQYSFYTKENAVLKFDNSSKTSKIQELDHTILSLKADLNNLTIEKTSAENRAAIADSIPLHVPSIISNLDNILATEPTNRQQLLNLLYSVDALTNALAEATLRPTFDLYINDIPITDNTVLSLKTSRILNILVSNTSPISAEQLEVAFLAPASFAATNLTANGWIQLPTHVLRQTETKTLGAAVGNGWQWRADSLTPGERNYHVNSLEISTNYQ